MLANRVDIKKMMSNFTDDKALTAFIDDIKKDKIFALNRYKETITKLSATVAWKKGMHSILDKIISLATKERDIIVNFYEFDRLLPQIILLTINLNANLEAYKKFMTENKNTLLTTHFNQYSALINNIATESQSLLTAFEKTEAIKNLCQSSEVLAMQIKKDYLQLETELALLDPRKELDSANATESANIILRGLEWSVIHKSYISCRRLLLDLFNEAGKLEDFESPASSFKNAKQKYFTSMTEAKSALDFYSKAKKAKDLKEAEIKAKQTMGQFKSGVTLPPGSPTSPTTSSQNVALLKA